VNNYLLRWTCNGKSAYKTGISKWNNNKLVEHRFGDTYKTGHLYDLFDIKPLAGVQCSSESYSLARAAAFGMEHAFRAFCPKEFQLEEHFGLEDGILNGMGGITEFFLMPEYLTEDILIGVFERAHATAWQLNNKLKAYQGTATAEMKI
jgi:hypothetical protein|tara:strand:- start:44 stop:490 length:447 start_codon:yes stop_codon:yes gene_type:complete